jgi:hypothetical protein
LKSYGDNVPRFGDEACGYSLILGNSIVRICNGFVYFGNLVDKVIKIMKS